jgi:GNAT superfamily N-acetyltransferase
VKVSGLRSEQDLMRAFPVVRELHRDLTEEHYAELLAEMRPQGYRLFAAWEGGEIVAVAGVVVLTNLYYGCHAFVYDLVTKEGAKSGGYGEALMDHVEEFGRAAGCEKAALACGCEREVALRFYERRGYGRPNYAMRKDLR